MCKCTDTMNKHLEKVNTRLAEALTVNATKGSKMEMQVRLMVSTVKIDPKKRGKAHTALATFCPFCGTRAHPQHSSALSEK